MLYWQFHIRNEILVNCLFTKWKCTYIYWILELEREVHSIWDLWTGSLQECLGNVFFEVGWGGQQLSVGSTISWIFLWGVAPAPIHLPLKARRGRFDAPPYTTLLLYSSTQTNIVWSVFLSEKTGSYNEMKLILKFGKPKKLMGLKTHHDDFKPSNFLEWPSVVASTQQRLMSTWWSKWTKNLRLPRTTFSNSDANLSLIGDIPTRNVPH